MVGGIVFSEVKRMRNWKRNAIGWTLISLLKQGKERDNESFEC
jgi:hypothetical protein